MYAYVLYVLRITNISFLVYEEICTYKIHSEREVRAIPFAKFTLKARHFSTLRIQVFEVWIKKYLRIYILYIESNFQDLYKGSL